MLKSKPMPLVDDRGMGATLATRTRDEFPARSARAVWIGLLILSLAGPAGAQTRKYRIFVVSSYHREYLWSQDTQKGVCAGLLEFGFLDTADQAAEYTRTDTVESSSCVVKKTWMDTKRKNGHSEMAVSTGRVMGELSRFSPDLVLLGDDNAANYVGNQLMDTEVPVVFWGINGLPLRYGLLDSLEKPGHNITGVYQPGYLEESLEFLQRIVPGVQTFAVLSDDSETGRAKVKALESLHKSGKLPLRLVESVVTNRLEEWRSGAMRLRDKVDAFFVTNHNSLKDENGDAADPLEIGAWYLRHIRIPECADERQFAQEGMLCVCDDSGYKQGYDAVKLACRILKKGERPREIEVKAPSRGPFIVNRERAQTLGIVITPQMGVEETIEKSLALEKVPDELGAKR
jgi:ABC-type uncharacterized transport system substrate-binding protein